MKISPCQDADQSGILDILNEAILHSTALYDYKARSMESMDAWMKAKRDEGFPVVGMFDEKRELLGFASYGRFRNWPAYKYTIEHSVYVKESCRGRGIGSLLLTDLIRIAEEQGYHNMIGGIDAENGVSMRLHEKHGFQLAGKISHAGYKFGRWLDLVFYQKILTTPFHPSED